MKRLFILIVVLLLVTGCTFFKKTPKETEEKQQTIKFSKGVFGHYAKGSISSGIIYFSGGQGNFKGNNHIGMAKKLNSEGYHVIAMDYSSLTSTMEFSHDAELEAAQEAITFMSGKVNKIGFLGTSHGGDIVMKTSMGYLRELNPKVVTVVELGTGFNATSICAHWKENNIETSSSKYCDMFDEDMQLKLSSITLAENLNIPALLMHGTGDSIIPVTEFYAMDSRLTELGKKHTAKIYEKDAHAAGLYPVATDDILKWFKVVLG